MTKSNCEQNSSCVDLGCPVVSSRGKRKKWRIESSWPKNVGYWSKFILLGFHVYAWGRASPFQSLQFGGPIGCSPSLHCLGPCGCQTQLELDETVRNKRVIDCISYALQVDEQGSKHANKFSNNFNHFQPFSTIFNHGRTIFNHFPPFWTIFNQKGVA